MNGKPEDSGASGTGRRVYAGASGFSVGGVSRDSVGERRSWRPPDSASERSAHWDAAVSASATHLPVPANRRSPKLLARGVKRFIDILASAALLVVLSPVFIATSVAVLVDSRGPVFFRCRRVGHRGTQLAMLKFRKMYHDVSGPSLTAPDDERFTRVGRFLARSKLDELPQLWNVLRGDMSLVGPRPEDPGFVALHRTAYEPILEVKPGVTGLSQLAFFREGDVLDPHDRTGDYVARILPQKLWLDALYTKRQSPLNDLRILWWTAVAIGLRRQVAVHRSTGRLSTRRRDQPRVDPGGAT
jgi:lipopolysaccharide/colanic/teichoic acid biosynthesis glycosyltransferase